MRRSRKSHITKDKTMMTWVRCWPSHSTQARLAPFLAPAEPEPRSRVSLARVGVVCCSVVWKMLGSRSMLAAQMRMTRYSLVKPFSISTSATRPALLCSCILLAVDMSSLEGVSRAPPPPLPPWSFRMRSTASLGQA